MITRIKGNNKLICIETDQPSPNKHILYEENLLTGEVYCLNDGRLVENFEGGNNKRCPKGIAKRS